MPFWLQLTAAVSAALASGVMGIAFVPFLRHLRFCEPEHPEEQKPESADIPREACLPTMGGLLLVFGTLCGLAVSGTLCLAFGLLDRTSGSVQQDLLRTSFCLGYALLSALAGVWLDLHCVRRKPLYRISSFWQAAIVWLCSLAFVLLLSADGRTEMNFTYWRWDAGVLYAPLTALLMTILWMSAAALREEPDGTGLATGGVLLLALTLLFLSSSELLHALLSLTGAGACMGCLVWCLVPAKCRIGSIGSFWLSGCITALCTVSGRYLPMLLVTAAYLVNLLPCLKGGRGMSLQARMQAGEMNQWQRIAVFAGFAALCGALAVMIETM